MVVYLMLVSWIFLQRLKMPDKINILRFGVDRAAHSWANSTVTGMYWLCFGTARLEF